MKACKFYENIEFKNVNFSNIVSFINSEFNKELVFSYVIFDETVLFSQVNCKEFRIHCSYFRNEVDFLNFKVENCNRETARIIKDSFEQQNNIIEANKFYALEMKEREKELDKDKENGKNFFEWLVFKVHGLSSNHSQDWLQVLYWIISLGFVFSLFNFYTLQVDNKFIHFELNKVLGYFV